MNRRGTVGSRIREIALWVGAVLGVLCLLLGALAWLFDIRPLVFRSGSMSPAIEAGAVGFAREVPATEVAEGDVVSVVDQRGVRVTHRVVSVDTSGERVALRLKGDANSKVDQETYRVDDVYRVFGDVPYAGYVVNAASTPWGLLVCGGFVTLLLVSAFGGSFGGRGSGGDRDGGADGTSGTGEGKRRAGDGKRALTRSLASVAAAGVVAIGMAPMGTMASWADNSRVSSGALRPLSVTPPGNVTCESGVFEWLTINWTHADVRNVEYRVVITRASDGATVLTYPWQPAPVLGASMKQEVRATGTPSVPGLGNFWATVQTRLSTQNGGWSTEVRYPIRRNLVLLVPLMFCGHL